MSMCLLCSCYNIVSCDQILTKYWPLCCLFFDIRILISPLVSSNSSYDYLLQYYYDDFHHKRDMYLMLLLKSIIHVFNNNLKYI